MSRPYETPATESHLCRLRCALTVEEHKKMAQGKLAQSTAVPASSTNGSLETQNSPTVHRRPRWASLQQDNKDNSKSSPTKPRSSTAPAEVTEQLSAAPTTPTATTAFTTSTKDSHTPKPPIPPSQLQKQPTTAAVSNAPQPPQQKTTTLASKPHENPPRPRWFPPIQPSTSSPTPPTTTTTTQPLQLPCPPRRSSLTARSSRPRQRTTLIVPHSLRHLRAELATAVINTTTTTTSDDDDDDIDGADSDASANTTFSRRLRRRARAEQDLREEWVDVGEEAHGHARRAPMADRSSAADSGGRDAEGRQWEELDGEKELEVSSFEEEKERRRIKKEARAERRRRRIWRDVDGLEEDEEDGDDEEEDDEIEEWEEVEKEEAWQPESSLSALRLMDQVFKTLSKL